MITIVAIGKKHEAWILPGLERYGKRLRAPYDVKWILLPHSSLQGVQARQEESECVLARLDSRDHVILLDETGAQLDSPALARQLESLHSGGKHPVFVIGGAYGVSDALKDRADTLWSLSDLVFPHQLVRLLLAEQLYRAQTITNGQSYHHS